MSCSLIGPVPLSKRSSDRFRSLKCHLFIQPGLGVCKTMKRFRG